LDLVINAVSGISVRGFPGTAISGYPDEFSPAGFVKQGEPFETAIPDVVYGPLTILDGEEIRRQSGNYIRFLLRREITTRNISEGFLYKTPIPR
jgi:hypothetical protein